MDPLSQGLVGATASTLGAPAKRLRAYALLGALSGMAPDLDVLIRSSTDPLLFLEYHRQFTHALAFIPVGALICAAVLRPLARSSLANREIYFACLLGYASHGVLDSCTSYGTQLFWPFSDMRVAWNNVSVVDPLLTLGLGSLMALAIRKRSRGWARIAALWLIAYLLVGVVQRERAEAQGSALAASRGHAAAGLSAKPAFGSLLLWKTVYREGERYYVDAVRVGWRPRVFPGESARALEVERDLPWLESGSQQARDLERFRWFSNDWIALDPREEGRIIDIRYSMVPNRIRALWGIELREGAPKDAHVRFFTSRDTSEATRATFQRMLFD